MHTGMLWFDNSNKSITAKIQGAIDYYVKKYGVRPDIVLVNPSMLLDENGKVKLPDLEKIRLRPYRPVLPGHLWLGIEDEK